MSAADGTVATAALDRGLGWGGGAAPATGAPQKPLVVALVKREIGLEE